MIFPFIHFDCSVFRSVFNFDRQIQLSFVIFKRKKKKKKKREKKRETNNHRKRLIVIMTKFTCVFVSSERASLKFHSIFDAATAIAATAVAAAAAAILLPFNFVESPFFHSQTANIRKVNA